MVDTLVPICLFISFTVALIAIVRIVSESRVRRRLIETGASVELAQTLVARDLGDLGVHASLQWGLITGAVGVALIIVQYLPIEPDQPAAFGLLLVAAALGMLGYYFIGRRLVRHQRG